MLAPTSPGDVLDRLTILELKTQRIDAPDRVALAADHRDALKQAWDAAGLPAPDTIPEWRQLGRVNGELWEIEDALRAHEARGDFGPAFVARARSVYRLNDERSRLKASVDRRLGARHPEVKSYATPPPRPGSPPGEANR